MGSYLYDRSERPSTVSININKMDEAYKALMEFASQPRFSNYGWMDSFLKSKDFIEAMRVLGIGLEDRNGDGNYYPVFDMTYCSTFFDNMIPVLKPFVNKGTVFVYNDCYGNVSRSFR